MVIALDLDEVVFNYIDPFLAFVNKKFSTEWVRADVTSYSFEECGILPPGSNSHYISEFAASGGLVKLPLMPDAGRYIDRLAGAHHVFYITSRDPKYVLDTYEALSAAEIMYPVLHSTCTLTKAQIITRMGADVLVDDSPRFVNEVLSTTPAMTVLFSNIGDSIKKCPRALLAHKWADLYRLIT